MKRQLSPLFTWRGAIASKESDLKATQRHVALTLSLHMSEKGDSCFPGIPLLAEETGLGQSTVRDSIRRLDEKGWLIRDVRGGRESNRYTATVPTPPDAGGVIDDPPDDLAGTPPASGGVPASKPGGTPPVAGAEDVSKDVIEDDKGGRIDEATDFVGFFVDEVQRVAQRDPLENAKARVGRDAKALTRQGVSADVILKAITEIVEIGLGVGSFQGIADQIHRGGYRGRRGRPGGLSAADWAAAAREENT